MPEQPRSPDKKSPSAERRRILTEEAEASNVDVSNFFPIDSYYRSADTVLESFIEAYKDRDIDNAYLIGVRYCNFVVKSIPKHSYYNLPQNRKKKENSVENVRVVMKKLEENIVKWMDEEEIVRAKKRAEEARIEAQRRAERARLDAARKEKERQLRLEREKEEERRKHEELMERFQRTQQPSNKSLPSAEDPDNVQSSALSKLELLKQPPAPRPPQQQRSSTRYALSDTSEDEDGCQPLPPPLLPPSAEHEHSNGSLPPAPPHVSSSSRSSSTGSLPAPPEYSFAVDPSAPRRNPFLGPSPGNLAPPAYDSLGVKPSLPDPPSYHNHAAPQRHHHPKPAQQQPKPKRKYPVRQLRDSAKRKYQELQQAGRIEIRPIGTYQGRYSQSTNGCTVISPLVVARHLRTTNGVVLADHEIVHVIDKECGPLLREIRGKLGLENHSLIIPSDVHDHLVDKNILKQEYFVGATGGNIIDEEHIQEFMKLFQERAKAGAALFFREHVVSIVKIPAGNGRAYFDLVDSMPGTATTSMTASRTRCKDLDALRILLLWYATKKFSESNCSFIDRNDWNDSMADFDPRVFQAFVWGDPES